MILQMPKLTTTFFILVKHILIAVNNLRLCLYPWSCKFPVQIDFQKCREEIAGSLNEFCNRWCKREHVECDALKDWK